MARHRKDVDFERPSDEAMGLGRTKGWGFEVSMPKHRKLTKGDIVVPLPMKSAEDRYVVETVCREGSDWKFHARGLEDSSTQHFFGYVDSVVRVPWA